MARITISDSDWWMFLGAVSRSSAGGRTFTCGKGADRLADMERAGLLWLKLSGGGYEVRPTREGVVAAHRWAARKAKEAALQFGAPRG